MEKKSAEGASKGKRFSVDCAQAGQGCSLKISGTYDEVMNTAILHGKQAHAMSGDDSKIREDLKSYIKEDQPSRVSKEEIQGGERRESDVSDESVNQTRTGTTGGYDQGFQGRA